MVSKRSCSSHTYSKDAVRDARTYMNSNSIRWNTFQSNTKTFSFNQLLIDNNLKRQSCRHFSSTSMAATGNINYYIINNESRAKLILPV